jgi:hypothetical protein
VKNREKSWRPIREDTEEMEEFRSHVVESAELVIVLAITWFYPGFTTRV